MTTAMVFLGWTLVLALVQIFVAAAAKRGQDSTQWAMGNRDSQPTYTGVAARMQRAQANLFETLPIFIAAVLLAHLTRYHPVLAAWGAGIYFWARLIYIPAYAAGLSPWRSIIWGVSMIGLLLVLISLV